VNYFFNPKARAEHLEHVAYYESQQQGLGIRYLAAFKVAMDKVCAAPHRPKVEFPPNIRRYRVAGFPYNILYRIISFTDRQALVLKYWLLPHIVVAQITGSIGFKPCGSGHILVGKLRCKPNTVILGFTL
jgi:toxin ParE1/3/4